jgi:NDP-sugar pyrophosphorylase family protein
MNTIGDTTVAILAGGLGTRLRPVLADCPKVLAPIGGKPFLACLLEQLAGHGFRDVVLCVGYQSEQVEAAFGRSYAGLRVAYSREPAALGTAGAVRLALPLLKSDPVLVMNGDSFCAADLPSLFHWHAARKAAATLLLARVPDTRRYGRVQVDGEGLIRAFEEKGQQGGPGCINAGIYLLGREVIAEIPPRTTVSLERETFVAWLGRGLYGCLNEGPFLDIGTPASYAAAEEFFSAGAGAFRK